MVEIEIEHGEAWGSALAGGEGCFEPLRENAAIGQRREGIGFREFGDGLVGFAQIERVMRDPPQVDRQAGGEHETGDQDDPGTAVTRLQKAARGWRRHDRQPGRARSHDILRPVQPGCKLAARLLRRRRCLWRGKLGIEGTTIRRAARAEEVELDALRCGAGRQNRVDHLRGHHCAGDKTDEIAAALVHRAVRHALPVNRQQKDEAVLNASSAGEAPELIKAEPRIVPRLIHLFARLGIRTHVETVERRVLWHG